jgi:hypothetical protein
MKVVKYSRPPGAFALRRTDRQQIMCGCRLGAALIRDRNFNIVDAYGQMSVHTARMLNGAKLAGLPCRAIEQARSGH